MTDREALRPRATIVVATEVVESLVAVTSATGPPVVLVGGWAVRCRLLMASSESRPTDDLDVLLRSDARPARAALATVHAVQSDPSHPCRLIGLPLLVDVLTDDVRAGVAAEHPGRVDELIVDPDGLNLLVPPFAELLARSAEPVRLVTSEDEIESLVMLPLAGALLAAKVANIALEFRTPDKRASDGEDTVRLTEAFGVLALLADLELATPEERTDLHQHLVLLGAGGIGGQARAARFDHDADRLRISIDGLVNGLS